MNLTMANMSDSDIAEHDGKVVSNFGKSIFAAKIPEH
jgi:hypothetical protein